MNNFLVRTISTVLIVPIFLFMIFYNHWSYFLCFGGISSICLYEFLNLNRGIIKPPDLYIGLFVNIFFYTASFFAQFSIINLSFIPTLPLVILLFFYYKIFSSKTKTTLNSLGIMSFGWIYVTLPFCLTHLIIIKDNHYFYGYLLFTLLCIWASDIGGYLFGNLFGKRKIFPSVSPQKTWEGTIGSIMSTIVVGIFINFFMNFFTKKSITIIVSMLIGVFSIWGDLFQSFIKRSLGTKDSGKIIPGHGGMLDRFDSFIGAIVLVSCCLKFVK